MSVMSLVSMAISDPVPIAMPTSAWAKAGASLTPSPRESSVRELYFGEEEAADAEVYCINSYNNLSLSFRLPVFQAIIVEESSFNGSFF